MYDFFILLMGGFQFIDYIEKYLSKKNFDMLRDKRELKEMDCISDYMDKIETSYYVVLLISEPLKSYKLPI